jgi:hypothetical protein
MQAIKSFITNVVLIKRRDPVLLFSKLHESKIFSSQYELGLQMHYFLFAESKNSIAKF